MVEARECGSMATESTPRVRLVKCPKCRKVLPEIADVPVYKCGGCDTILIAKNKKINSQRTSSGSHQLVGPETKECSSPLHRATLPPSGGCSSLNENDSRDQNLRGDSDRKRPEDVNLSSEGQNIKTDLDEPCIGSIEPTGSPAELAIYGTAGAYAGVEGNNESPSLQRAESEEDVNDESSASPRVPLEIEGNAGLNDESSQSCSEIEETDESPPPLPGAHSEDEVNNESSPSSPRAGTEVEGKNDSPASREQALNDGNSQSLNDGNSQPPGPCSEIDETDDSPPPLPGAHSEDEVNNESPPSSPQAHTEAEGKNERPASPGRESKQAVHDVSSQSSGAHSRMEETDKCPSLPGAHSEDDVNDESLPSSPGIRSEVEEIEKSPSAAGAYPDLEDNYMKSVPEVAKSEAGTNDASNSNVIRGSNANNLLPARGTNPTVTANAPTGEGISSRTFSPSPCEQPQKTVHRGFNHVRSADSLEASEFIHHSSELSSTLEDMSKCPTTKSSHAYEGSVSSFEGMDDKFPERQLHSFKNNYEATNSVNSEERLRRGKFPANGHSEMPEKERKFSSVLSKEKHYSAESSKWNQDELLGTRHGHPVRNYPRLERDEFQSQMPFYQRGSRAGPQSGRISSQFHNEFHRSSTFHSHGRYSYADDKMRLLRMVCELQDQLKHTHHTNEMANGRLPSGVSWREKHIPRYYDPEAFEEEVYQNLNQHGYHGRYKQGSFSAQQSKISRIPFSGEAINCRHQVDHSCLCCHPQDWHCSAELPPSVPPHNQRFCRVYPCDNCDISYSSCPTSPLQYLDSEYSVWSRETKSDDKWPKDHDVKKYRREKQYLAKRHLQPTAGGAPLISCYICFKVLLLPVDFLLFKRKCHRLRCGSCMEILKFSLQSKTHIVPYTVIAPPPSEFSEFSHTNRNNLSSASRAKNGPHADPVSCSDDYEHSYSKSYSTDGDPVSLPSSHDLQGNTEGRSVTSGSRETNEFVLKQSRNKLKSPVVKTYDSPGPSSNTLGIEQQRSGGSPLHRLMGYSSPSAVIYGCERSVSVSSSVSGSPGKGLEPRS